MTTTDSAMHTERHGRRRFLTLLAGVAGALALGARPIPAVLRAGRGGHPEPRPGIDGSKVLEGEQVPAELAELCDRVRLAAHVADGIRGQCDCADVEGFYSLLTCYEDSGMALHCNECQDVGELVTRMHAEGRTLKEIRAAVDRHFG